MLKILVLKGSAAEAAVEAKKYIENHAGMVLLDRSETLPDQSDEVGRELSKLGILGRYCPLLSIRSDPK